MTRHTSFGIGHTAARALKKNPLVRRTTVHSDWITVELYKFGVGPNGVADLVNYELLTELDIRDVFDGWVVFVPADVVDRFVEALAATHVVHFAK